MRRVGPAVALVVAALAACGTRGVSDRLIVQLDSGADGADAFRAEASVGDATPYLGAPCIDDGQCNDMLACTYDSCDRAAGRCLNVPDDTQCADGLYCDGKERCVPGHGCEPGPVVTCSDGNSCHIARCVEATKSCAYAPRDADGDGDPDGHCAGGRDCNDLDPNVSSLHAEVCANGIDDNCDGNVDETPCVTPAGGACQNAIPISAGGTYTISTVGANDTMAASCGVTSRVGAENVVAAVTVPPGPNVDLEVWATTAGVEVAVAIDATCGQPSTELACASGPGASSVRARARRVAPGTYAVVVTTQSPASVDLQVELLPPTSPPLNVDCPTAAPVQPGSPTAVAIIDPPNNLPSACGAHTGALTYSFTLARTGDVRVFASAVRGSGRPVIGLRPPGCAAAAGEIGCQKGSDLPLYARGLPAGTYVITVAATAPIDASIDVELSPPTASPPDQSCAAPPALGPNARQAFDLANHELSTLDGCFSSAPDFSGGASAAYDLTLPSASDVLLVARIPQSDRGAVSLDAPACSSSLACDTGTTPLRVGRRNVAAADYRVVVADALVLAGTIDALVRPTVAPTVIPAGGADTCALAVDVAGGGFFTGDTSMARPDYGNPCDAPTSPPGGAPDQVLALSLVAPQRVVFDMEGSSYTTTLDLRSGPGCPGTPVAGGCYVGFGAQRSFLDLELPAGVYWIIIDGYSGGSGPWDLDVRVLPP